MPIAFLARDDARTQLTLDHRAGFLAGVEAPQPAEACTELGADTPKTPKQRAREFRHLGVIVLVAFIACCCFTLPLAAHFVSKPAPQVKPVVLKGVWA
jgi:hypothetical protein